MEFSPALLRGIRAKLDLTQEALADRLGVSFATVNRWEGGDTKPQRAAQDLIDSLTQEAGIESSSDVVDAASQITRRRGKRSSNEAPSTKPMEQMLWDAACSIRGEKEATKFKDYLLPLLFLKIVSNFFCKSRFEGVLSSRSWDVGYMGINLLPVDQSS